MGVLSQIMDVKVKLTAFESFMSENGKEESISKLNVEGNRMIIELDSGEEYLVLTECEADEEAEFEIRETIWAFNSPFIIEHMRNCDKLSVAQKDMLSKAIKKIQENLCENANPLIEALIDDVDTFVYDAIQAEGRGNFISGYDGKEHEAMGCYIYRID